MRQIAFLPVIAAVCTVVGSCGGSQILKPSSEGERIKPGFVMTVGEMIQGYSNDTSFVRKEWEEYFSLIQPFTMPIHFTPGNNDIWDSASQILYERRVSKPYYSFTVNGVHFIALDNSRWETVGAFPHDQIDLLKSDLEKDRDALNTLVFFHEPSWIETVAQGKPDTLHSIFASYGVDAVFSGNCHVRFAGEFDHVKYAALGSSGGSTSPGLSRTAYAQEAAIPRCVCHRS